MWTLYVLRCGKDNSLYCGITNNLEQRLKKHQSGKGAKYTRLRGPLEVVYNKEYNSKSEALKEEYRFKQLSKKDKEKIVS